MDLATGTIAGDQQGSLMTRALHNHNLWLAVAYVGLLLLMARPYA
jgi:hypothetical protein